MATLHLARTPEQLEALRPTREFLAAHGIAPDADGEYREDHVLAVIRAEGWEATMEPGSDPPGWDAEITRPYSADVMQSAYGEGDERSTALIDALRHALTLTTAEESERRFDELSRDLLGFSGKEFMRRWRTNELDLNDSRVEHLLIARPSGW